MLSDSWGRHRVLSLALFGMVLALSYVLAVGKQLVDLRGYGHFSNSILWIVYFQNIFSFRLVLIYPLFCFVGGGAGVISAMWYTVIADIMPINAR